MWLYIINAVLFALTLNQKCNGINLINFKDDFKNTTRHKPYPFESQKQRIEPIEISRRNLRSDFYPRQNDNMPKEVENRNVDDRDGNLKAILSTLVQQTTQDTEKKIAGLTSLKDAFKDNPAYRIGFILSSIKKSRDMMNELFNVALNHREEWMVLDHVKYFELIVNANVEINNQLRELVEIHLQNLNPVASTPGVST